jgi:glutamine amidotransferase
MHELKKRKLIVPLKEKIKSGAPYLGLCLGLQLLFSTSEEGKRVRGLDIIPGPVRRFRGSLKVPHMGWNTLRFKKKASPLLKNIAETDYFYFVHSYYGVPEDPSWTLAVTRYGKEFCSAVWKKNIFATQFHPEKSQLAGLRLVKNFIDL